MRIRLALALWLSSASCAFAACPPVGYDRAGLESLKAAKFAMADAAARNALAGELLDCLGDPDPALRDGIAYEALSTWMRAGAFDAGELRTLRDGLYAMLDGPAGDGYAHPFAALVLSEVARTDIVSPWMTPAERDAMVRRATGSVGGISDYRGYDPGQGWRHGVAHGADWLMQLARNPQLERAQGDGILAAVASQAVPASGHAYIFGESQRLVGPVVFIAQRGFYTTGQWQAWFASLIPRLGKEDLAYADVAWLGRRHDLMAFLLAAHVEADHSGNPGTRALKPAIVDALKAVP
jgi:hypothetical protein